MKSIKLRRRVIVCGAIIILLYCYFTPKYFFNPNDISVHHIEFSGETIHTFDEAKVKIILSKIQGQRTFRNIDPYIGIIEINCYSDNLDYLCKALKYRHFRGYGQGIYYRFTTFGERALICAAPREPAARTGQHTDNPLQWQFHIPTMTAFLHSPRGEKRDAAFFMPFVTQ